METLNHLTNARTIYGDLPDWGKTALKSFVDDMLSEDNPFPCILGVEGLRNFQLRFCFIECSNNPREIKKLATHLKEYLQVYKDIGRNTSFVAFFKPENTKTMEEYEQQFWSVLQELHENDSKSWPKDIPEEPSHPLWEFSFQKEPIFVVCNTPAHEKRKSRYSSTFMMTFQPRWVFEGMNAKTKKGKIVQKIVRDRLQIYDEVAIHPELSWYGDPKTREWKQYFLRDTNEEKLSKCPFHTHIKEEK